MRTAFSELVLVPNLAHDPVKDHFDALVLWVYIGSWMAAASRAFLSVPRVTLYDGKHKMIGKVMTTAYIVRLAQTSV